MPTQPSTIPTIEPIPNSQRMLRNREAIATPLVSALSSSPGINLPRSGPEVRLLAASCRGRLCLGSSGVGLRLGLIAERPAEQPSQLDALLRIQPREHLVLHALHPLLRALQCSHAS